MEQADCTSVNLDSSQTVCTVCGDSEMIEWWNGKSKYAASGEDVHYQIWECLTCGFGMVTPYIFHKGLYGKEFYSHSGELSPDNILSRLLALYEWFTRRERVARLGELKKGQSLLDFGCGNGRFVKEASEAGWKAEGVEPSSGAKLAQDTFGIKVRQGSLSELEDSAQFDRITLWHVLEHIPFPQQIIRELTGRLKVGGKLLVSVPNYSSLEARIFRSRWALFDVPRHLNFFSEKSLHEIVAECGLVVEKCYRSSLEYDFPIAVQSWLNVLTPVGMVFYKVAGKKFGEKKIHLSFMERLSLLMSILWMPIILPLALFQVILLGSLGQGGTLTLICSKK